VVPTTSSTTPTTLATARNSRIGQYSPSIGNSLACAARRVPPLARGAGEDRSKVWCPKGDSNPHDLSRYHLKVVRLPIPPSGHCFPRSVAGRSRRIVPADQPPLLPGGAVWTGAGVEFGAGAMTGAEGVV